MMQRHDDRVTGLEVVGTDTRETLAPGGLIVTELQFHQPHERIYRDPMYAGDNPSPLGELVVTGPAYATVVLQAYPGSDPSAPGAVDALSGASGKRIYLTVARGMVSGIAGDLCVERAGLFSPTERATVRFTLSALDIVESAQ